MRNETVIIQHAVFLKCFLILPIVGIVLFHAGCATKPKRAFDDAVHQYMIDHHVASNEDDVGNLIYDTVKKFGFQEATFQPTGIRAVLVTDFTSGFDYRIQKMDDSYIETRARIIKYCCGKGDYCHRLTTNRWEYSVYCDFQYRTSKLGRWKRDEAHSEKMSKFIMNEIALGLPPPLDLPKENRDASCNKKPTSFNAQTIKRAVGEKIEGWNVVSVHEPVETVIVKRLGFLRREAAWQGYASTCVLIRDATPHSPLYVAVLYCGDNIEAIFRNQGPYSMTELERR